MLHAPNYITTAPQGAVLVQPSLSGAFESYADHWLLYERLLTQVRYQNYPVGGGIPRIQQQIASLETTVAGLAGAAQAKVITLVGELRAFEAYHMALWKQFEDVIDALCDNAYVRGFVEMNYQGPRERAAFETLIVQDRGRKYDVPTERERETLKRMFPANRVINSNPKGRSEFKNLLYERVPK